MHKDVDVMWNHVWTNVLAFQYLYVYTYILMDMVRYKICVINCAFSCQRRAVHEIHIYIETQRKN